jgi:hypothetical protein
MWRPRRPLTRVVCVCVSRRRAYADRLPLPADEGALPAPAPAPGTDDAVDLDILRAIVQLGCASLCPPLDERRKGGVALAVLMV